MTRREINRYKGRMFRIGPRNTFFVNDIIYSGDEIVVGYKSLYHRSKKIFYIF